MNRTFGHSRIAKYPLDIDHGGPELEQASAWLDDARLFATGWLAGLVFFGTFLA
jgi:hypothetical protein